MSNEKVMIIHLIVGQIKKILLYKMSCFSKQHTNKNKIEVELDLPNYATKSDLANLQSEVDKLDIDKLEKVLNDLNSLKSNVDKLDIGKLETTPADLSKLSDEVKNDVVKNNCI